MSEVVRAHGNEGAAAKLECILHKIKELAWLEEGTTAETTLSDTAFALMVLEAALEEFMTLGQRVHDHWQPQHMAPALPMELNGKKGLADRLRNGKKGAGDGKNPSIKVHRHGRALHRNVITAYSNSRWNRSQTCFNPPHHL